MTVTTVTRWKPYASQAGAIYGIPTAVLLALIDEESGGNPGETSSTGAKGLTQFEPGTAVTYHVDTSPGGEYSQILGAAHYLHDLGYSSNPTRALASYNAGPGNWQAGVGYANAVLTKARAYGANTTTTSAPPHTANAGATNNPLVPAGRGSGDALKYLLYAALFTLGAGLLYMGVTRTAGKHPTGEAP